jgi:protein-S-isoprenylcysteine O-methyltransferase Ste14
MKVFLLLLFFFSLALFLEGVWFEHRIATLTGLVCSVVNIVLILLWERTYGQKTEGS